MSSDTKKVVWPINPYESSEKLEANMVRFLEQLGALVSIQIQPVYVMTSAFTQMMSYFKDVSYDNILRKAQEDCASYIQKFSQLPLLPVQLVENRVVFKSAEVSSFLQYLQQNPADFVCLTAYGKETTKSLFLGSFAESYLRQSTGVSFVIGPQAQGAGDLTKALVPVEGTEESREFVRDVLSLESLSFLKKIKLFHKVTLEDYFQFNASDLSFYGEKGLSKSDMLELAKKVVLDVFSEFEGTTSVDEMSCMLTQSDESIASTLLEEAQKNKSGLIIMRSHTGPFLEAFVGSITKEVVAEATCPVVVYPYRYRASQK